VPNTKSAIKRAKVAEKKRIRNKPIRSAARTYVKHARRSIAAGDLAAPRTHEALQRALSYLDHAASKGVIHKNNAARRKSRLMKLFNKAQAAQSSDA
jgi:small subunit ribosomal protein S20